MTRFALPAALVFASVASADPPKLPPDLDMVPRDAGGFVSVKVAELWASPKLRAARDLLMKDYPEMHARLVARTGLRPEEIARATAVLPTPNAPPDAGYVLIVSTVAAYDRAKLTAAVKAAPPAGKANAKYLETAAGDLLFPRDARTLVFVVNSVKDSDGLLALFGPLVDRKPDGPLSDALAAAVTNPLVVGTGKLPMFPEPPADQPAEFVTLLFPGVRTLASATHATGVLSLDPTFRFTLTVGFPDAARTARARRVIGGYLALGTEWIADRLDEAAAGKPALVPIPPEDRANAKAALAMLEAVKVDADRNAVRVKFESSEVPVVSAAFAAVFDGLAAGGGLSADNDLKQIGLAWHNFEAATGRLPANVYKDGKPILSWRVQLLPYIEQEGLYKQFKLDEPWDSEHNRKLLPKMPKVYALGGVPAEPGHAVAQAFVGKKGVTPRPVLVDGDDKGLTLAGIPDGTSNTLLVAEATDAVPWTKPADIRFDPAGVPAVGGKDGRRFRAAFADGSVRRLDRKAIPDAGLRALVTVNGGENYFPD